ncbi:hypothetical protein [Pseudomonas eucalypticola]|uniref:Uncharacterized protein n=1 Tax=Pseudomonas eucalypticola TaxID=2599595 RepID=A0A7D5D883_9PSED|nr:hypothetical protein [Pseudomonas eucalypticola]QKZ05859.1 hypothetical protein HWQ56_19520 [Pseudomonas eucalypticola]
MSYEIIVEEYVLQVEITHFENIQARPGTWDSDWDSQGSRELEFKITSAATYNDDGKRVVMTDVELIAKFHAPAIETALWHEIDSQARRRRVA